MAKRTQCASCGAPGNGEKACWLCGNAVLTVAEFAVAEVASHTNPYDPPATAVSEASVAVSIPLVLTVIIVSIGLALAAPGFGIPLAVVVTPALIRTIVQIARNRSAGTDISTPLKAKVFLASLAGTVTACVAAGVAFFATCAAGCFGVLALDTAFNLNDSSAFAMLIIASAFVGLICGWLVLKRMWRRKALPSVPYPDELEI